MIKLFKEKVFENKRLMRWASLAFALVLVVTVAPYIKNAWGGDGDGTLVEETIPEATPITEVDFSEDSEDPSTEDPEEEQIMTTSEEEPEEEGEITTQETEAPAWIEVESGDAQAVIVDNDPNTARITGNGSAYIKIPNNPNSTDQKIQEYTLIIDDEITALKSGGAMGDIVVGQYTTLNLEGDGTLRGNADGSVIAVMGNKSTLNLNANKDLRGTDGLTITGGTGSASWLVDTGDYECPVEDGTMGGAIHVQRVTDSSRDTNSTPSFHMYGGKITGNTAGAGGGVYIGRRCNFTMDGGEVSENVATTHEGGGIYTAGPGGKISRATITNNKTETGTDWGGGGLFIESKGSVKITSSTLVTNNEAKGLGAGISGCPHAKTGINHFGGVSAIAIYGNKAEGSTWPDNIHLNSSWAWKGDSYGPKGDWIAIKDGKFAENGAELAEDFYCIDASIVYAQNYVSKDGYDYSWIGRYAKKDGTSDVKGKYVKLNPYDPANPEAAEFVAADEASLGLTAAPPANDPDPSNYPVVITGNKSGTHGGGIGLNGTLVIGEAEQNKKSYTDWSFEFVKNFSTTGGNAVAQEAGEFTFGLYKDAECKNPVKNGEDNVTATNDSNGNVKFTISGELTKTVKDYPVAKNSDGKIELYVKEIIPNDDEKDPITTYDESVHKVVISLDEQELKTNEPWAAVSYLYNATVQGYYVQSKNDKGELTWVQDDEKGKTFTNIYHPKGTFELPAIKNFYTNADSIEANKFSFTAQRITEPQNGKLDLDNAATEEETYRGTTGEFKDGKSSIVFEKITLTEPIDYWFMVTEDKTGGATTDPCIYVVKVTAQVAPDGRSLNSKITGLSCAVQENEDDRILDLREFEGTEVVKNEGTDEEEREIVYPDIEFDNFDDDWATMSIAGYAVDAATDEPLEKECFVDPKIYKELIGRSLQPNEFEFQLIKLAASEVDENGNAVPDWSQTKGEVISQTKNDRYGMVDFDAANDVTGGKWDSPSCLYYTEPGTYYYRVVEVGDHQATVKYSDQIITFTTVIDYDDPETKENLVCKDMYYGTVIDGKNVRYSKELDESYSDSPDWHPTMTNYAKGMDLQVRKTSELDRNKGLEGATYALYMANDGSGTDILIDEGQTSDENGVITFKDVNLRERTLYYFKEVAAPDGHTVSEFRSDYFYLMPVYDSANENIIGYKLDYAENKDEFMQQVSNESNSAEDEIVISAMSEDDALISTQANDSATANNDKFVVTYDKDGGVYDEATNVEFNKLDTRTHEWVEGAKLQIVKKDNGQVVNEWVSGKKAEKLEATLNVETDYILREVDAPEGYEKADDVVFRIDQYGAVRIVEGDSNGNAEISGDVITLYDTMLDVENVTTEYRETPGDEGEDGEGTFLAKTGDILKIAGIAILAIAAICGIVFALRRRSKNQA